MREYLLRLPVRAKSTFDARSVELVDEITVWITDGGIAVEAVELINAVTRKREPEVAAEDGSPPSAELIRDEWPHLRIFSDADPTDRLSSFDWSARPENADQKGWRQLREFAARVDAGETVTREEMARGFVSLLRLLERERRRG